ncbi:alanine racemase [Sneathiella aquimaris]|uniref:alanine racemase n=1 Tax=Sneathiella aquimaris TaxID=2599305 RepID=UPI00146EDF5D|nr:alanine racemase [Sneathiella aquimaris]
MSFGELSTPTLLLEKTKLIANINKLDLRLSTLSTPLRPHLKTCKSARVAELIPNITQNGITVSTLHEARYFLDNGHTDILYAVSIAPQKLTQIKQLQDQGASMTLILDTLEAAKMVAQSSEELQAVFPCLIEIDCDGKRAGLPPQAPEIVEIAAFLNEQSGTQMKGVLSHSGGSYYCQTIQELQEMAEQERISITTAAQRIRNAGLPCPVVSAGSTPTATYAATLEGVTEYRAGVYVFQDMVMEALGVCQTNDIALSILTTVISHNKSGNRLIIDAGSLALSTDPGKKNRLGEPHYGCVCDATTGQPIDGLWVTSTNQEHGLISLDNSNRSLTDFPIGTQFRILPNHACITAAAYPGYHILDDQVPPAVIDYWDRSNGW